MIRPPRLRAGDRLAAVSLSWGGAGTFPDRFETGKRQMEAEFGIELVPTRHALRDADWLHRNPQARADDLMEAFSDDSIRGIVSVIGGDDSIRILPFLDDGVIRSHPKVFLGYSDTTVTHWACFAAGLTTFYGPSVLAEFAENGGILPYTADAVRAALFSSEPVGRVAPSAAGWTAEHLDWGLPPSEARRRTLNPPVSWRFLQGSGTVEGQLMGGCLEVVEFLRGTRVWPEPAAWEGAILFLESSEEAPPPLVLTRALRSYAALGVLERVSGILMGRPGGDVAAEEFGAYDDALLAVVRDEEGLDHLPVVTCMDFGHTDPKFVLPFGARARIDCDAREFHLLESGVTG